MIFAKNFARNYEKENNTWNIRRLVNESFVPETQQPSEPVNYIEDCWISKLLQSIKELTALIYIL